MHDILTLLSSVATAVGVLVAAWQILQTRRQNIVAFEDSFAREYRKLAAILPTKALLGEPLTDEEHKESFDEFYHYFDLSNEQAFLHLTNRITPGTWKFWHDGMASNLRRPAFKRAWNEIAARANGDFAELRQFFPPELPPPAANETVPAEAK